MMKREGLIVNVSGHHQGEKKPALHCSNLAESHPFQWEVRGAGKNCTPRGRSEKNFGAERAWTGVTACGVLSRNQWETQAKK